MTPPAALSVTAPSAKMLPVIPLFPLVEPIVTLPPLRVVILPTKPIALAETLTFPSSSEAPVNVVVALPVL